jgi:acetyltransferase-like isoleucine patch superfamily enzyme
MLKDKHGQPLTTTQAGSKIINRLYQYYLEFKVSLLWFLGYIPSHTVRKLIFTLAGIKLGKNSTIHIGARFYQPKNIQIGEGTIIGDHATLDGRAPLSIGNHVDIASGVLILNSQHDLDDPHFTATEKPITIGDYVFIGPRAIILPGVTLAKGAVVAAGAVVTKNVEEGTIVGGIPAKPIRKRTIENYHYRLGRPALFQ